MRSSFSLAWLRSARTLLHGVLDLAYPPRCVHCGARVPNAEEPLCAGCLAALERAGAEAAQVQLARLPQARGVFGGAFALWFLSKDGALEDVQHALKYRNRPRYGVTLGRLLGSAYRAEAVQAADLVVPIPLHSVRRYERGYNQSAYLARGVAEALGLPLRAGLLRRARAAPSQTDLPRARRWANVSDAFAVADAAPLAGGTALLVDDVLTTGATATAAAQALRRAGAASVALATLAMARS